jgi:uncharacterized protein YdaL
MPPSLSRRLLEQPAFSASLALAVLLTCSAASASAEGAAKRVLIVYEPGRTLDGSAEGDALQLRQLLGHFAVEVTLTPAQSYKDGALDAYAAGFYVGFSPAYRPPAALVDDVFKTSRTFVWLNTGMDDLGRGRDLAARFGFVYRGFVRESGYDVVVSGENRFTRLEREINLVRVVDPARAQVLATASTAKRSAATDTPYIVRSGSFWYVADSPLSYATEGDRYLLFADLLHDILAEPHPSSHSVIIRIEDTNPFSDPETLRAVADRLSALGVPFLVGVTPFYVNPATGVRVAMSAKPDYVDALHYMAEHGGTVVLHGSTHQYKGESASDYEFWDESGDRPIPGETRASVERRVRDGLLECFRNGVYPLLWETPHYAASKLDYAVFAEHFSTAIEQRLVADRLDQSQYFPYVIRRDMYGETLYPENLGYVPLEGGERQQTAAVEKLLGFARANLVVRDGFASAFFHPFLPLARLEQLVRGLTALGYTFIDLRDTAHVVKLDDRAIVCGAGKVTVQLDGEYLLETTLGERGVVVRREFSQGRLRGAVEREVHLPARGLYVLEPREYSERPESLWDKLRSKASTLVRDRFMPAEVHQPADVLHLEDQRASGGALNDQRSLAAPFRALNVPVETAAVDPEVALDLARHNLVLVPYNVAELLSAEQIGALKAYVERGGNLVMDFETPLSRALGIAARGSNVRVERVRDQLFPEETLRWGRGEVMSRFESVEGDEIFAIDAVSETPVAIGRRYGKGRIVFFGTRFDPIGDGGYTRFPYLTHYVERFCGLMPLLRREQLEMFFEPGYRHNISIDELAVRWAAAGVRVIHASGWAEFPKHTYDYRRLIQVCHANGILVYAWIEPPQVTEKLWREHPEWREKNYKGADVRPSWRYPVALTDTACRSAAFEQYRRLLTAYDWDGVNIAEVYFEAGRGFEDAEQMTPLHPSARAEFSRHFGFDPLELFDAAGPRYWRRDAAAAATFVHYRADAVVRLHEQLLSMAESVRAGRPGFDIVVTAMDSLSMPILRDYVGVDTRRIAELSAHHDFTLQVEDPESMWSQDPRRYAAIAKSYASLVPPQRLALDLNILRFRGEAAVTPFPTRIPTGTESAWLLNSASQDGRRVTIYSESSANPQDLPSFNAAYAAGASVERAEEGWTVRAPFPTVVQLRSDAQEAWVDDQRVYSLGGGRFLLPEGQHRVHPVAGTLQALQPERLHARMLSFTGGLRSLASSPRSVDFSYRSATRAVATFDKEPIALFVDKVESTCTPLKGAGRFALLLPPGEHAALVVTQSTVLYSVDFTSAWSSYLIAVFGALSGALLLGLYVVVRVRRPFLRRAARSE